MFKNINYWYVSSITVSLLVALPILTVFASFFGTTSEYYELLKNTFLLNFNVTTPFVAMFFLYLLTVVIRRLSFLLSLTLLLFSIFELQAENTTIIINSILI